MANRESICMFSHCHIYLRHPVAKTCQDRLSICGLLVRIWSNTFASEALHESKHREIQKHFHEFRWGGAFLDISRPLVFGSILNLFFKLLASPFGISFEAVWPKPPSPVLEVEILNHGEAGPRPCCAAGFQDHHRTVSHPQHSAHCVSHTRGTAGSNSTCRPGPRITIILNVAFSCL